MTRQHRDPAKNYVGLISKVASAKNTHEIKTCIYLNHCWPQSAMWETYQVTPAVHCTTVTNPAPPLGMSLLRATTRNHGFRHVEACTVPTCRTSKDKFREKTTATKENCTSLSHRNVDVVSLLPNAQNWTSINSRLPLYTFALHDVFCVAILQIVRFDHFWKIRPDASGNSSFDWWTHFSVRPAM